VQAPAATVVATTAAGVLKAAAQLWLLLYCIRCAGYRFDTAAATAAATAAGGAIAGATAGACYNMCSFTASSSVTRNLNVIAATSAGAVATADSPVDGCRCSSAMMESAWLTAALTPT
jgi:hypothetical protein